MESGNWRTEKREKPKSLEMRKLLRESSQWQLHNMQCKHGDVYLCHMFANANSSDRFKCIAHARRAPTSNWQHPKGPTERKAFSFICFAVCRCHCRAQFSHLSLSPSNGTHTCVCECKSVLVRDGEFRGCCAHIKSFHRVFGLLSCFWPLLGFHLNLAFYTEHTTQKESVSKAVQALCHSLIRSPGVILKHTLASHWMLPKTTFVLFPSGCLVPDERL